MPEIHQQSVTDMVASAAGFSNPYQYTGRELDQSGLYYYRARYYSPQMGRFISEDPIGLAGGLNVYGYVGGDPISLVDPWGLETCLLTTVGPGGIRDHAAIYTSRGDGRGGPSLYDPAGDYGAANGGGSGGIVEGDPLNRTTTLEYWNGCLIRATDPLGRTTRLGCNAQGQPVSVTTPLNRTTRLPGITRRRWAGLSVRTRSGWLVD